MSVSNKRIFIAGHRGLVGSALMRRLSDTDNEILVADRSKLDLADQKAVRQYIQREKPDIIIIAAAKVGGIGANSNFPAQYLMENLQIETNLIDAAHRADVNRLLFLGSSCIYPKMAAQPILETALLTGPLEPTNQYYAIAKISGMMLCDAYRHQYGRSYISAMPTNLYGPNDNFHIDDGHVIPSLMNRFHKARISGAGNIVVWGSGRPLREFMFADDLADALVFLLANCDEAGPINVGTDEEVSIASLAAKLAKVTGYRGELMFDTSKPDGTPRKLLNTRKLKDLGWHPRWQLMEGLEATYYWYCSNIHSARGIANQP